MNVQFISKALSGSDIMGICLLGFPVTGKSLSDPMLGSGNRDRTELEDRVRSKSLALRSSLTGLAQEAPCTANQYFFQEVMLLMDDSRHCPGRRAKIQNLCPDFPLSGWSTPQNLVPHFPPHGSPP